jgi:glutathione S-transferase
MHLYGFPPSPNTWKVRAAADHLGIPIEFHLVDLFKGAQKTSEYRAINPLGRTPTLVDGDFKLWESNAILQYLGSKKKNDLWPEDARKRADITRWQCWQLAHWSKACEPIVFERLVKPMANLGAPDEQAIGKAEEAFHNEGKMLDAHLSKQAHLVGDRLTLADFSVGGYLFYAEKAGLPLSAYRNIGRWFAGVAALPAWQNTAPKFG